MQIRAGLLTAQTQQYACATLKRQACRRFRQRRDVCRGTDALLVLVINAAQVLPMKQYQHLETLHGIGFQC